MTASQPKQSVGKHNSGSFSQTQPQLFTLHLPPPAYKCHSHKSKMTILLLARARCWAKNNVFSSGFGTHTMVWVMFEGDLQQYSHMTKHGSAHTFSKIKASSESNFVLIGWSFIVIIIFYIMPQQQLYELLALNKYLKKTHQYVSLKQQFFCGITWMLLTYHTSQRASAAPLHCLWPWALALASNEFMHIVSSAACVSVASFLRCSYLPLIIWQWWGVWHFGLNHWASDRLYIASDKS